MIRFLAIAALVAATLPVFAAGGGSDAEANAQAAAVAQQQVLANSTFTHWSRGSPVAGSYGSGSETADGWISKWNKSTGSRAYGVRRADGYRYNLQPDRTKNWRTFGGDGGETFYLRQYYRPLSASLGKRFRVRIDLTARYPDVRGGWYIYPMRNSRDRLFLINTVGQIVLPMNRRVAFTRDFKVPVGPPGWATTHYDAAHAGLATAFLFTTAKPALVDIHSFQMWRLP